MPGRLATEAVFLWVRATITGSNDIQTLSFIHFARWGIIRKLPSPAGPSSRLAQPLFLFESNYNGTFEQYIDAFAQVLGPGMESFWFTSYGFPGPLPVQPFKDYIRSNEFVLDHYYLAYPTVSTTEAVAALELRPRHVAFKEAAAALEPAAFAEAFDALRRPPPPPAPPAPAGRLDVVRRLLHEVMKKDPRPGRGSRSGRSYYFTALAPISKGKDSALAEALAGLDPSPFAAVPRVHLGRFLVVDSIKYDWPGAPSERTTLASSYLLCTAVVTADDDATADGLPGTFLDELLQAAGGVAATLWKHCEGFPDADREAQVAYLEKCQLDTVLFYVGYPDVTPAEVRRAAAGRDLLSQFAYEHRDDPPAALQAAYVTESATWDL
ncbi:MAG TPA: hypothetical protein VFJ85_09220 [Acidimicrobiales bacterium]|nr:hypothetical protein [Acidimicrobiales bacterium]